jgi:hypothetical protein
MTAGQHPGSGQGDEPGTAEAALLEQLRMQMQARTFELGTPEPLLVVIDEWPAITPGLADETILKRIRDIMRAGRKTGINVDRDPHRLWRQYATLDEMAAADPPLPRHSTELAVSPPGPWTCPRCRCLFEQPGQDHEPCRNARPQNQDMTRRPR